MEGAGLLTACAALLFAPLQWWRARAQKLRLLGDHELHLRRATHPLGVLALLAWGLWLLGARDVGGAFGPVFLHPSDNWPAAALLSAVTLYGLASFVVGAGQCWGMRSDPMLPFWAVVELALGVAGLRYLWVWNVDLARGFEVAPGFAALWLLLVAASIWCAVVGFGRLFLLMTGGSNALALVNRHMARGQLTMRPVRSSPWWWPF